MLGLLHCHAFGDLELDGSRTHTRVADTALERACEVRLKELTCRDIDADARQFEARLLPNGVLLARLAQNRGADRSDQSRVLGDRNERSRFDERVVGGLPSNESFDAEDLAGRQ